MPSNKPRFFGIHADSMEEAERIMFEAGRKHRFNPGKEAKLRECKANMIRMHLSNLSNNLIV